MTILDSEVMAATDNTTAAPEHTCQYIAGDPSADDACKCRRPAMPGSPYCEIHAELYRAHVEEMEKTI